MTDGRSSMRYKHNNGGGWATTVDDSAARLYVSGMWSLDVYDLRTGAHLTRHRTGFGTRAPFVSPLRNRVFVPSTLEGTIRAYNRDTLEYESTHPVGLGVRNLWVTHDEMTLIGSHVGGTYYWALDQMVSTD